LTTRFPPIRLATPGEEISKKDLHAVLQRFKHFNASRLQRVRDFLQPRQHDFLDLLPLLFHVNHPLLPGFIALETPIGITDYTPDKRAIVAAQQFSKGFTYQRKALKNYPVHSLFLMGSVGSMAFSRSSDIDIWLCHEPGMATDDRESLRQKAEAIEKWAASLKLEVHFFLVDGDRFKQGDNTPISSESSGETQHYLLLEEFYRTAIYIAGRVPIWWLVPPEQAANYPRYVAHLLENRFIAEHEIIDFGGLHAMPMAEFVSATLWHVYKSLTSPHKALLKLLLMESYASEFPQPRWLCDRMKQAIYDGDFSVDSLDPYWLMYGKVDDYLRVAGSVQRLSLARECLYIKIMAADRRLAEHPVRVLRDGFLASVAARWQWPPDLLASLGSQRFWDIKKARAEHAVIRTRLQQCLKVMLQLTGGPAITPGHVQNDIKLLSRKLSAFLDTRPDKIEILTTRTMVQAKPEVWSLAKIQGNDDGASWCLFTDKVNADALDAHAAVKRHAELFHLLVWAVVNGLYRKGIHVQLITPTPDVSLPNLGRLLIELDRFMTGEVLTHETTLQVYAEANRIDAALLLVNWGESLALDADTNQLMMSERSDPLSYGERRHCFVQGLQCLSVSRWGELTLQHYQGLEGFFHCLCDLYNHSQTPRKPERLTVLCHSRGRARSIVLRIEQIHRCLLHLFADTSATPAWRYLLPAGAAYGCFRLQAGTLGFYFLENNEQLLHELASTQATVSPVWFDDYVLEHTVIPLLYQNHASHVVQVFGHVASQHVAVYVIDERGALFTTTHRGATLGQVLAQYQVFIETLLAKRKLTDAHGVAFYEIEKNLVGVVSCKPLEIKPTPMTAMDLDLKIRVVLDADDGMTVYCNDSRHVLHDRQSVQAVRDHVMQFRQQHEDYPVYITDIDVAAASLGLDQLTQAHAAHYFQYKRKVEARLNGR